MFLRNHFKGDGTFEMPKIRREEIDLEKIELIGYDKLSGSSADQIVHFFLDDYKFEVIWNDPLPRIEKLKSHKAVLSPNFSVYTEMPLPIKIYNTFRGRWCGAYLQSNGVKVIPTLAWGGAETFWFCFEGVEKKSVVAVSTLGVRSEKDLFMQGYNEMLRRINPEKIICYGKPFDEMKGDIVEVDYAKTNNLDKSYGFNEKYIKKTVGYVLPYSEKGMGSAGGTSGNQKFPGWDPTKPEEKAIEYIRTVQLHQNSMKERYVMLEKNDWRLTNQEEYLKNAKLIYAKYKVLSPHWDHDHCVFCWEKFGENDEDLKQGYCTPDKTYWICEECFNDFKEMFNFQVI